jgi:carbonic anhydrase
VKSGQPVVKIHRGIDLCSKCHPAIPEETGVTVTNDYLANNAQNEGEAHVIRNAGGVVTDDVIRSLAISQRLLGTQEIILIHHSDCGMLTFTDDDFKRGIQDEIGVKPPWAAEAFPDLDADVRQSLRRIENSPFVTKHVSLRGFVFDVASGKLNEVTL